jgi:hypothetical protein
MKSATPFRLYYRLETLQNLGELENQLTALIQAGIHGIIINPNTENFDVACFGKNSTDTAMRKLTYMSKMLSN